jgi:N-methylhydantoinase B
MNTRVQTTGQRSVGVELALLQSRFEGVIRAMLNTLLRSARSAVLGVAHDFSCCVVTADGRLFAWAESIPIHTLRGPDLMSDWMHRLHPRIKRGDAFLNNSPYHGNTHAADWSLLVPVIDDQGVHRFTVVTKAHQGDCGNAKPTTYDIHAKDVYEEGALIFPCVRAQEEYRHNEDLIRMCRMRVRVPDQMWGDYLALLGAARIGERRVLELIDELGADRLEKYTQTLFDHSEQTMKRTLQALPSRSVTVQTAHDPTPEVPEGVPLRIDVAVDGSAGSVTVDLRDNPDCVPCGLNLSEACALTSAFCGVFMWLGPDVPPNAGSFRRINVLLRDGCVVGIPTHPHSCSAATTDLADRVSNAVVRGLSESYPGMGLAEFGPQQPPAAAVVSGTDPRHGRPFINQIFLAVTAGAGGAHTDGWLTAFNINSAGMLYRDSVEIDELKMPIRVREQRVVPDSEGAGRRRGAPSARVTYEPVGSAMDAIWNSDGCVTPARGVLGGGDGGRAGQWLRDADGTVTELPGFARVTIQPHQQIISICSAGAGWGSPFEREIEMVVKDVRDGFVTRERARDVYGVALDPSGTVDDAETKRLRDRFAANASLSQRSENDENAAHD